MEHIATPEDVANVIQLLRRIRKGLVAFNYGNHEPLDENSPFALACVGVERILDDRLRQMIGEPPSDGGSIYPNIDGAAQVGGVRLRDYFIAHAPAVVPSWFRPNVGALPDLVAMPLAFKWSQEERQDIDALNDGSISLDDEPDCIMPRVRDYVERREAAAAANVARAEMIEREAALQWPAFWADEQIARRVG